MKNKLSILFKNKRFLNQEKNKKQIIRMLEKPEDKRDFLPLFNYKTPLFLSENERKNKIMEVAKKYFEVKKSFKNKDKIG